MPKNAFILNFLRLYNILWTVALPILKKNRRLAAGFEKRIHTGHLKKTDLWIQAASAGESYLAVQILTTLSPNTRIRVLVTTITEQGLSILKEHLHANSVHPNISLSIDWFPFDQPEIMKQATERIRPSVMMMLETEIWPALIHYLKIRGCRIAILNARLSKKSFNRYMATRFLWKHFSPDLIAATSARDALRYRQLFLSSRVQIMSNIKFEAMDDPDASDKKDCLQLDQIFTGNRRVTILASIRKQEETQAIKIIKTIKEQFPHQIIAVFPRHMHRIKAWKKILKHSGIPFQLRSETSCPPIDDALILWDTFGELKSAYSFSSAVFVGGSLAPLGGQNFLEPAILGVPTIIGPHYDDFIWVGDGLFARKIVYREKDWQAVARRIIKLLNKTTRHAETTQKALAYIQSCKGGTQTACSIISRLLTSS